MFPVIISTYFISMPSAKILNLEILINRHIKRRNHHVTDVVTEWGKLRIKEQFLHFQIIFYVIFAKKSLFELNFNVILLFTLLKILYTKNYGEYDLYRGIF